MDKGPVLLCTEGPLRGRLFPIPEDGDLKIGRAADADVCILDDDGVSRHHGTLRFDNGSLWIRDAGSRNGIYVNDKRISEHKGLSVGDAVSIGDSLFEIRWSDDARLRDEPVQAEAAEAAASTEAPARGWRRFWPFS